jgi:predicted N-acetyltransferase YhbS
VGPWRQFATKLIATSRRAKICSTAPGDHRALRRLPNGCAKGRSPAAGLSLIAEQDGKVIGTVRLWHVCAGTGRAALLLGPLAVDEGSRGRGIGSALMRRAIGIAERRGHDAVVLVGDAPYYQRFGFSAAKTGALWLPRPFERQRLLGCELKAGALDGACGLISATGRSVRKPTFNTLVARSAGTLAARHAA